MAISVSIRVFHDIGDAPSDNSAEQAGCTATCTSYYSGTTTYTGGHPRPGESGGTTSVAYTNYQLSATPATGWYFKGWDVITRNYVTGGLDSQGNVRTDVEITTERTWHSTANPLPADTTATDYTFPGDLAEANPGWEWQRHTFKWEIIAVYAQFAQGTPPPAPTDYYTVSTSATPQDYGSTTGDGTYGRNESCTITATPNNPYPTYGLGGRFFEYWELNGATVQGASATYTFPVTSDASFTAHFSEKWRVEGSFRWSPLNAVLKFDGVARTDEFGRPLVSELLPAGSTHSLEAVDNDPNFEFDGWYRVGFGSQQDTRVTQNKWFSFTTVSFWTTGIENVFYAQWRDLRLTIRATASIGGFSVTVNGQLHENYVLPGSNATLQASPLSDAYGYRFLYWSDTDPSTGRQPNVLSRDNPYTFTVSGLAGDIQYYYAYYGGCSNIKSSVSPDGGGTITYSRPADSPPDDPSDHWYVDGSSVSLTAIPAAHYQFVYWEWIRYGVTHRDYNATHTIDIVSVDIDFVAHFELIGMGQLIYDDTTGRLICADATGQLIYHDKMIELPASS